jgi:hypothetical protein
VKWYGHVAMAGEDRNIYTSNAETCGWTCRLVVVGTARSSTRPPPECLWRLALVTQIEVEVAY